MSDLDRMLKIIQRFEKLSESIDEYDRHNYYLDLKNKKKPALIIMQLSHTGNGYINGRYVNSSAYKTTKAGDINI